METPETIHAFWFGTHDDDARVARAQSTLWWKKDPRTDEEIRQRFEGLVAGAASGALDLWRLTPIGQLALILLTDQFPRSMYRDTPKAFAFDHLARSWCKAGLEGSVDRALRPIERVFFYLPLEHSESLEDQQRSVALFAALADGVPVAQRTVFDDYLNFAVRHRDVIARFGRFPHRNHVLERVSSSEEVAFLGQKGSSF